MRNLRNQLLCASIVICGSLSAQNSHVNYIRWDDNDYEIRYEKNGEKKVLKGKHGVPPQHGILEEGRNLASDRNEIITKQNLNYALLDSLMWESSNTYRATLGLSPVKWNKDIRTAAASHSYYMAYFSDLTHNEDREISGRETEQAHYQAVYSGAAEICLYNHASLGNSSYQEVADMCIEQWSNSPGHNSIMISNSYRINGFGTALQQGNANHINREKLKEHNPALFRTIQREAPDAFEMYNDNAHVVVWASANYRWGTSLKMQTVDFDAEEPERRVVAGAGTNTDAATNQTTTSASRNNSLQLQPKSRSSDDHRTPTSKSNTNAGTNKFHNNKRKKQGTLGARMVDSYKRKVSHYKRKKRSRKNRRKRKHRRRR